MIQLPPKVSRGDQITASWANKVIEAIAALRPMAGAGTRISQNPGGFIISSNTGSSTIKRNPWDIIPFTDSTGTQKIKIWPGNINGFIPSNITDSFSVNDTELWFVKCKINSDGRAITGIQLMVDTAQPNQQQATANAMPSEFEIVVAGYDQGVAYNLYNRSFPMTPSTVFSYGYWTIG